SAVLHVEQVLLSDSVPILASVTQGLNKASLAWASGYVPPTCVLDGLRNSSRAVWRIFYKKESSEFRKRSFEYVVDSIRAIAASHLWQCFLEESRHLMRLPPCQSTAESDLMVPFQLAAIKTISDEDKYFSRVSLRFTGQKMTLAI
ncbi:hypothetical protein IFM89_038611, partial [Coptis chinensis]